MIYGNAEGVKNIILDKLEKIYYMKIPRGEICSEELIDIICEVTVNLGREISVAIDRKGKILGVAVGDSTSVEVPIIDIREKRLSGTRIIHSHPGGSSRLSPLDVSALIKLKLDCIVALGVREGGFKDATIGLCAVEMDVLISDIYDDLNKEELINFEFLDKLKNTEELIKRNDVVEDNSERAILIGIENEESLNELEELAKACEIIPIKSMLQKRNKIDSAYYIGSGKVEEIALLRQSLRANVIIFDDELSGSQVRNLEDTIGVKVVDRTTLILEIFARRAKSREAKIQVELAQLKYRLPRLMGMGTILDRTGGGIGTRGPGEKKLETDRRHIRERLYDLLDELERVKKTRETQREKRNKEEIPKISIVGYTNAGKSTLRNKLCEIAMPKDALIKEKVFEADMLFATLDTTTRAINLLDNRLVTLTDTVGFVRKLPHDLVEAFKSTLEEVVYADLLLHVVDVSAENAMGQIEAVNEVLNELGIIDKPILLLLNKIDKCNKEQLEMIIDKYKDLKIIQISAKNDINLELLLEEISSSLPHTLRTASYLIPYAEQAFVAFLHRNAKINLEEFQESGTFITAIVDEEVFNKAYQYMVIN